MAIALAQLYTKPVSKMLRPSDPGSKDTELHIHIETYIIKLEYIIQSLEESPLESFNLALAL